MPIASNVRSIYGLTPGDILAVVSSDPTTADPAHKDYGPITSAVTIWSYDRTTQITDLLSYPAQTAITTVTPDSVGRIPFYGVAGYGGAYYAKDANGTFWLLNPHNLAERVDAAGTTNLDALSDVSTAGGTTGYVLTQLSDGTFGMAALPPPNLPATVSNPTAGDTLYYSTDQNAFVNSQPIVPPHTHPFMLAGVVLNTGDPLPSGFPTGGVVLYRTTAATISVTAVGKNSASTSVTTLNIPLTTAISAGQNLVVCIGANTSSTSTTYSSVTITDQGNNSYFVTDAVWRGTNTVQALIYQARITTALASGSNITVTLPAAVDDLAVVLLKVVGLVSSSPKDQSATSTAGSATTLSTSIAATTQASEVAIAIHGYNAASGNAFTADTADGWTLADIATSPDASPRAIAVQYQILTAIGAVTAKCTLTTSSAIASVLATYKTA